MSKETIFLSIPLIVASNKKAFVESLKALSSGIELKTSVKLKPPVLELKCNCGKKVIYQKIKDIPEKSVQCDCGIYFIKYNDK